MTYNININQIKAIEWGLSIKAAMCLSKFMDLSSWATPVIIDNKTYYILYRSKLIEELPLLGKSLPTASRAIKELEDKEIIESVHKNTEPAYRVTKKGLEWLSNTSAKGQELKKSNDEENDKFTFRLKRELEYDDLSDEYKNFLKLGAIKYAKEQGLNENEFENFVNHKKSVGKSHKDWASAFKTWCSNAKKYAKQHTKTVYPSSETPKNSENNYNTGNMEL